MNNRRRAEKVHLSKGRESVTGSRPDRKQLRELSLYRDDFRDERSGDVGDVLIDILSGCVSKTDTSYEMDGRDPLMRHLEDGMSG